MLHDPTTASATPNFSDLVSLSEAARVIGVTPNTVWGWAREGRIPAKRVCAHCIIVRLSDVRALDEAIRKRYPRVTRTFRPGYGRLESSS